MTASSSAVCCMLYTAPTHLHSRINTVCSAQHCHVQLLSPACLLVAGCLLFSCALILPLASSFTLSLSLNFSLSVVPLTLSYYRRAGLSIAVAPSLNSFSISFGSLFLFIMLGMQWQTSTVKSVQCSAVQCSAVQCSTVHH